MIYPINEAVSALIESFTDQETGELIEGMTEERMTEAIDRLQMDFNEKVDALCSAAKNYKAEAADIKDEKMRLAKRQSNAEKAADRTRRFLGYLLQGQKFKNAKHSLYYQASKKLTIDDRAQLVLWCKINAPEFLYEPAVREEEVKKAIINGRDIPFAHVEENRTVIVR